ncbi:MAG: hypothetical protein K6E63_00590 [Lachnospiraceae bacterium]|nr:hypothetical protein [Lachnospiraceae bacterium]
MIMSVLNLIILLFAAILTADIIDKKVGEVLPAILFFLLLILYGIAILGKAHHSYTATMLLLCALWVFYFVKKKRIFPSAAFLKDNLLTAGFITYAAVIILAFIAYSNHFIIVWDDFHYNATFPKDMFYYGTMPTGSHSATFYRSYPPLMQLFFYWGFQGMRSFSDPMMFEYKAFLVYTCLLPVFSYVTGKGSIIRRISAGLAAMLLPYLFMYEMIDSLSMDTFMAALAGYALVHIIFTEKKDLFTVVKIILSLSCLTLVKQIAPVFTVIVLAVWFFTILADHLKCKKEGRESKPVMRLIPLAAAAVCAAGCYLSWKVFCNIKGNSVYLSGKLSDSISGGRIIFPDYAHDTVQSFIRYIFVSPLSLQKNGLSLFAALILTMLAIIVMVKKEDGRGRILTGMIVTVAGLAGYLLVLCYTYIFVFEQWEAESLSSVDRYFGTYAFILMYVSVIGLCEAFPADGTEDINGEGNADKTKAMKALRKWGLPVMTLVFLICSPWLNMYNSLIPANYERNNEVGRNTMREVANETAPVGADKIDVRTVLVVNNEGNSLYSRGLLYYLVPLVPTEYEVEDSGQDQSEALLSKCSDRSAYYVYFAGRMVDDAKACDAIKGAMAGGELPVRGHMYYYDENANLIVENAP